MTLAPTHLNPLPSNAMGQRYYGEYLAQSAWIAPLQEVSINLRLQHSVLFGLPCELKLRANSESDAR